MPDFDLNNKKKTNKWQFSTLYNKIGPWGNAGNFLKNHAFSDATCICLRKKCQGDILFIMRLHFDFEQG